MRESERKMEDSERTVEAYAERIIQLEEQLQKQAKIAQLEEQLRKKAEGAIADTREKIEVRDNYHRNAHVNDWNRTSGAAPLMRGWGASPLAHAALLDHAPITARRNWL